VSVTDPIADMLTRIRNACGAKHKQVDIPGSKLKKEIARILHQNKYIANFVEVEDNKQNLLRIYLRYDKQIQSMITGMERISKPSLRIYVKHQDLGQLSRKLGVTLLSTSRGILTDQEAKKAKVGGEVLFRVW